MRVRRTTSPCWECRGGMDARYGLWSTRGHKKGLHSESSVLAKQLGAQTMSDHIPLARTTHTHLVKKHHWRNHLNSTDLNRAYRKTNAQGNSHYHLCRRQVTALDFHVESPTKVLAYEQAREQGTLALRNQHFSERPVADTELALGDAGSGKGGTEVAHDAETRTNDRSCSEPRSRKPPR